MFHPSPADQLTFDLALTAITISALMIFFGITVFRQSAWIRHLGYIIMPLAFAVLIILVFAIPSLSLGTKTLFTFHLILGDIFITALACGLGHLVYFLWHKLDQAQAWINSKTT